MTTESLTPYRIPIEVRFNDLDGMGHVNNALYHTDVEQARCRFLKAAGLWDGDTTPGRFPLILARTEMDFRRPAHWADALTVAAWVEAVGRSSFTMGYAVDGPAGVVAEARAVLVWYDYENARSTPLPEPVAARLRGLVRSPL